jgi:hypothetical protein
MFAYVELRAARSHCFSSRSFLSTRYQLSPPGEIAVAARVAMRCAVVECQPGRPDPILCTCCVSICCLAFPSVTISPFIYFLYATFKDIVVFFCNALRRPLMLFHEVPRTASSPVTEQFW